MKTKSQVNHTPTPWRVGHQNIKNGVIDILEDRHYDKVISFKYVDHISCEQMDANATFIVRAVNSHEKLVEACRNQADSIAYLLDSLVERKCEIEKSKLSSQMGFEHGVLNGEYHAISKFVQTLQDMEMQVESALKSAGEEI